MKFYSKLLFVFITTALTSGCMQKKSEPYSSPGTFNELSKQKAQEKYCEAPQVLNEDSLALDHNFEDLSRFGKVVGFSLSEGSCALDANHKSTWKDSSNQDLTLSVEIKSRCVANNSLWSISSISNIDNIHVMVLRSLENNAEPDILIKASRLLNGNRLKEKLGFRLLTCKVPNN